MPWTEIEAMLTPQRAEGDMRQNFREQEWVKEATHHLWKLLGQAWRIIWHSQIFCKLN